MISMGLLPLLVAFAAGASHSSVVEKNNVLRLQEYHPPETPSQAFQHLSKECSRLGIDEFDVYGDFHRTDKSFLTKLERMLAKEMGQQDAVFMPSGVMAQSIALLIHRDKGLGSDSQNETRNRFACHHSSHLLLHEQEGYRKLLGMEPVILSTLPESGEEDHESFTGVPPLRFKNVQWSLDQTLKKDSGARLRDETSTLILELPHREIGGKLTPWEDVLEMRDYCRRHGISFHCDGARLFEANAGYENLSLKEMAQIFDSVYISFYKGLGGLSGAMLLGKKEFCEEARVWLRRFGGNLYTLMPYIVSAYSGYERNWLLKTNPSCQSVPLSFSAKRDKLRRVLNLLRDSKSTNVSDFVLFDPPIPEVNMVHGYVKATVEECTDALDRAAQSAGIRALHRFRAVDQEKSSDLGNADHIYYAKGYRTKFEWTMGEANAQIPDEDFVLGWQHFVQHYNSSKKSTQLP